MGRRRLTGAELMLGACLLLGSGRLFGQREIIATAETITSEAPAAPAAPRQTTVQPTLFHPDPPNNTSPGQASPPPAPILPPTVMLNSPPSNPRTIAPTVPATSNRTAEVPAAVLSVEVIGPDSVLLGQPLVQEMVVRNTGGRPIAEVHVEEPLLADVHVLKADPPAVKHDNRLVWDLPYLEAGGERRLRVELELDRPGELDLRPNVNFRIDNGLRTQVVRPPFSIEISADRTRATRGDRIRFNIQLANNGNAAIRNIKLYDTLPSGLHHPRGPGTIGVHFGDLQPGEARSIPLETTAVESGTFRNEVLAQADRGVEAKGAVDVVITEPNLALQIAGPTQTAAQGEVDFYLEVANPAAMTAKDVRLVQTLPPTFEVISASAGAAFDSNRHTLAWELTDLGAGQRHRVTFRVRVNDGGDWPMIAVVQSQNFPEARVNHTLHAEALPVLKLELHAREERLSVGQETVLRMHVFNKGGAPCPGVRLTAVLPEAVIPVKAVGPSNGRIEKQLVLFALLPQLDAHGDVVYCIHLRGQQAGKGPVHVELTGERQAPVVKEISLQVQAAGETAAAVGNNKSLTSETLR